MTPSHPLGCHRPRIADRIIFEKLIQVLRFGCSYASIADCTCGATTIRERRDEWIKAGIFAELKHDRPGVLRPHRRPGPGGPRRRRVHHQGPRRRGMRRPSPVDRGKLGMKRSLLVEGHGIPLGRVLAPANRHDSPLLAPTLDKLDDLGPLPGGHHRPPRRRLRLAEDPRRARRPRPDRRNRPQGRQGPDPGRAALARRADQRLAQRLQPAPALLRTQRGRHRRLLRPRRRHHHRP